MSGAFHDSSDTNGFVLEGRKPGTAAFGYRQFFRLDSDARLPLDKRIVEARSRAVVAKRAWQGAEPETEFRIVDAGGRNAGGRHG